MTEEELKQAQTELETAKATFEQEKQKFEKTKTYASLAKKYEGEIATLKQQIADRDETISIITNNKPQSSPAKDKSGLSDAVKKYFRI